MYDIILKKFDSPMFFDKIEGIENSSLPTVFKDNRAPKPHRMNGKPTSYRPKTRMVCG
jgi:hypothetical protein